MKVGFITPNNETARFSGIQLLDKGFEVAFLCPNDMDHDIAKNMILELNNEGEAKDVLHKKQKSFSTVQYDLSDCEIVGEFEYFYKKV